MRGGGVWRAGGGVARLVFAVALSIGTPALVSEATSAEIRNAASGAALPSAAILIDGDDRLTPEQYAQANGLSPAQVTRRISATGLVRCGGAVGTGQLVGANDVLVTAAHMLFAPGGAPRGDGGDCTFEIDAGGVRQSVPILVERAVSGSREPYAAPAVRDWAVAPLADPVREVRPYALGPAMKVPGPVVLVAAARTGGVESRSLERCSARQVTAQAPGGLREVALDCDAEGGTSGSALLSEKGDFLGVYVGFRSAHPGTPGPFSTSHYNFALTVEGPLRRAIASLTSRSQPLTASR
ncbi:S1 family peptidase [Ancylobacter sp. VNQ12]|uniref:S1 family peptidase n=1 Tax=Ancylobacter sp. VNQ12 TaxID=3400920 RepID=UPI003C097AD1